MPPSAKACRAGRSKASVSLDGDIAPLLGIVGIFVAAPHDLEEIAGGILEIDRLSEGALVGMLDRPFEAHALPAQRLLHLVEAAALHDEAVAEAVRTAQLVFGRHRHVV